jgi:predicted phage terminase large subunit-like protein
MTRFSDAAGMLFVMTRWHIDDPLGRMKDKFGDAIIINSYSALAEEDEKHRLKGDPLFPELKSKEFLELRKKTMIDSSWASLYQQRPKVVGGYIIKGDKFVRYAVLPQLTYRCIFADTAQKTAERNDYSVFECWGLGKDGKIYLIDLVRGKWTAPELKQRAIDFWVKHKNEPFNSFNYGALRGMRVEDKSSGTGLVQEIKLNKTLAIPISGIPRNKDKYTRALDCVDYIESGFVCIPENAPFVADFVTECEEFSADDSHRHDDQVDPLFDAIDEMLSGGNILNQWAKLGKSK